MWTEKYTNDEDSSLVLPRLKLPKQFAAQERKFVDTDVPIPTVVYVPHKRQFQGKYPLVSVHRRADGKYVVIEQRPIHTKFTSEFDDIKNADKDGYADDSPRYRYIKPPWNWSTKGKYIERAAKKSFHEPYLPPIKNRYAVVQAKVGSLENADHIPGGGMKKVPTFKMKWEAEAKIGSLPQKSKSYPPTQRDSPESGSSLKLPEIKPRYGATADTAGFTSIHYNPSGPVMVKKKKIHKKSRVGSFDNISYQSYGGNVTVPHYKTKWTSDSKIGSLEKMDHTPGGGNVQILTQKLSWKSEPKINSLDKADYTPRKNRFKVPNFYVDWNKRANPKVGSLDNADHTPRVGNVHVFHEKINWKADSKVKKTWKSKLDHNLLEIMSEEDEDDESFRFTV